MDPSDRERYSRQILFPGIGEAGQEALLRVPRSDRRVRRAGQFPCRRAGPCRRRPPHHRSTAITWSPATCIGSGCSKRPTPPKRFPRPWPRSGGSRASIRPSDVRGVVADLTAANAAELLGGADVILDGTDNFETRYLINDFAVSRGIPWIYGAAVAATASPCL